MYKFVFVLALLSAPVWAQEEQVVEETTVVESRRVMQEAVKEKNILTPTKKEVDELSAATQALEQVMSASIEAKELLKVIFVYFY